MKRSILSFRHIFILISFILVNCWLHRPAQAQMDDAAFFDRVNLDYPGLENIRSAVQTGDYEAAKTAYAQFQRNRTTPINGYSTRLHRSYPSDRRAPLDSESEQALRNTFTLEDVTYSFPREIDWHFNPTDPNQNPAYTGEYKREWTVTFNRLGMLKELAESFSETGNPVYAAKVDELINQWIQNAPFDIPQNNREFWVSSWRTLDAGLRVGITWPAAWSMTIKSAELRDLTIVRWAKSWMQHADYLSDYTGRLNWLTSESMGLYMTGVMFPEFKDATSWQELAISRLTQQLETDFYPDGAHVELSPEYHRIAAEAFASVVQLAQWNDHDLPASFTDKIQMTLDYLLAITMPNRNPPRVNDSGTSESLIRILNAWGMNLYPDDPEFQWIVSEGKRGVPPSFTSTLAPWAGHAVMRQNWNREANYLLFEYGPYGVGSHQHEDKLGVHIAGYGDLFVFETGRENYGDTPLRHYCLSSQAHSILTIDGLSQNREARLENLGKTESPYPVDWTTHADFDYAAANYGENELERYGAEERNLGVWRRHVLFVKPDIFVIADIVQPNDEELHTYHAHFHLNAGQASLDPATKQVFIKEEGRPAFSITPRGRNGLQAGIFTGQTTPEILGWELFERQPDRAVPTVRFEQKGRGPIWFAYVFRASPQELHPPQTELSLLETETDVLGLQVGGELGRIAPFQVLFTTSDSQDSVFWNGARYGSSAIMITSPEGAVYDLNTGYRLDDSDPNENFPLIRLFNYPNPANDHTRIIARSRLEGSFQLQVFDLNGRLVLKRAVDLRRGDNAIPLDVRDLPGGMYTYALSDGRISVTQKMTVNR